MQEIAHFCAADGKNFLGAATGPPLWEGALAPLLHPPHCTFATLAGPSTQGQIRPCIIALIMHGYIYVYLLT